MLDDCDSVSGAASVTVIVSVCAPTDSVRSRATDLADFDHDARADQVFEARRVDFEPVGAGNERACAIDAGFVAGVSTATPVSVFAIFTFAPGWARRRRHYGAGDCAGAALRQSAVGIRREIRGKRSFET